MLIRPGLVGFPDEVEQNLQGRDVPIGVVDGRVSVIERENKNDRCSDVVNHEHHFQRMLGKVLLS
jgi:hypothetical protein